MAFGHSWDEVLRIKQNELLLVMIGSGIPVLEKY
jgi:hypothetical protein